MMGWRCSESASVGTFELMVPLRSSRKMTEHERKGLLLMIFIFLITFRETILVTLSPKYIK